MWSGPIGIRLYSGSMACPPWVSTSITGTALVAAPGPSRMNPSQRATAIVRSRSLMPFISQRLRDPVLADKPEVNVHQQGDGGGQEKDMDGEEALERVRTHGGPAVGDRLDQRPQDGRRGADLDRDRGRPVGLGVPG